MQTLLFKIDCWCRSHSLLLIHLFLIVATSLVYVQVTNFEFINFDDTLYVTNNRHVQSGFTLDTIKWAFTTRTIESWQPLVWLSFMLDYEIYGLKAGGFHLTNVLLHILSTLLLFMIMNRITGSRWRSLFIAAFFAIHPLRVESVAWIAERKDTLSAFFFMLILYVYVRYTEKPTVKWYSLLLLCFVLGLMSKPMLVTLPLMFILLDYWPLGRISSAGNTDVQGCMVPFSDKSDFLKIPFWQLKEKAPLFFIALVSGVNALNAQGAQNVFTGSALHPLGSRIANAFLSYWAYLLDILAPHNLAVFYPYDENMDNITIVLSIFAFLLFCGIALAWIKRYPFIFVGWSWFVIMLLPVIGIIPLGKQFIADRYTYLPSIGISFILAWGIPLIVKRNDMLKKALMPMGVSYLCCLGVFAWIQCGYWKDNFTLFSHALDVTENNDLMHYNIAWVYMQRGDFETAKSHLEEALRINPGDDNIYTNLGAIFMQEGETQKAAHYYKLGIKINPLNQTLQYNLGKLYEVNGDIDKAIEHFEKAISLNPGYIQPYESIAAIHYKQGDTEKAIALFVRAVKENPGYELGHYRLANYFANNQNYSATIKHLHAVIEINPLNVEAMYYLGIAYSMINNFSDAKKYLQMVLQIMPENALARQALSQVP